MLCNKESGSFLSGSGETPDTPSVWMTAYLSTAHLWHQRGWNIVDNIRFDPVGFSSLVEGQATSSATLVPIGQWPIVPVKHKKKLFLIVIMTIAALNQQ